MWKCRRPRAPIYPDAVIRKALASVTFRPTPIQEQLGMLPFKLDELAGFRVMQALPGGAVILTEGPTDDLNKQPYMIVSVGRGAPSEPDERGKFARELLSSAPLRDLTVTVGGADADRRLAGLRDQGAGQGTARRTGFAGAMGALRHRRLFARRRRRPQGRRDRLFNRFRAVRDGIDLH